MSFKKKTNDYPESPHGYCPDKIDEIMFNTAICLANIWGIIRTNNHNVGVDIQKPGFVKPHNSYFRNHKDSFKPNKMRDGHRWGYCSDEFYLRMDNSPPYTTEKLLDLYWFRDLSVEELQTIYEAIINSENTIKTFMPQKEILGQMHKEGQTNMQVESDGYMRTAQDKYIRELYSAAQNSLIINPTNPALMSSIDRTAFKKLTPIANSSLLNPYSFGFRWPHTVTYQADYPFQNWRDDIPDIMLRQSECYSNMIKTIIDIKTPKRPRQEEFILDEINNTIENEKTEEELLEEINSDMLKIFRNKLKENETKKNEHVRGGNKTRKNKTKKQKRKRKPKPKTKTRNKKYIKQKQKNKK